MRRLFTLSIIIVMLFGVALAAANAQDVVLEVTVKSVTSFIDKNGDPCIRIIVDESRTLKGVNYTVGVPVMAFSSNDMFAQVKGIKAGDPLHVIASESYYKGQKSYRILAVVK